MKKNIGQKLALYPTPVMVAVLLFISLSAMAQQVIDTHAHMIPQSYLDCLAKHDTLLDEDFPIPHW